VKESRVQVKKIKALVRDSKKQAIRQIRLKTAIGVLNGY